ncbi:alpha/beta hydrolase [Herbaspirillum chlorophenolicum]|uniref:alpha/beta hydrolase n=1 Tax=Herbaspirillum chlorophenolicum TaxID=211589 RepID=UPI001E2EEA6F|nr:alpha/beta hydrolase [Herbaspirillum chlorophenolicum]
MTAQQYSGNDKAQELQVRSKLAQRLKDFTRFSPAIAALVFSVVPLMLPMPHARAAETTAVTDVADVAASRQIIQIGAGKPYSFALYSNRNLQQLPAHTARAVVFVHGVKRNADEYFLIGLHVLKMAQFTAADTLLIAPNFMVQADQGSSSAMPLWSGSTWMQGEASERGVDGVTSFQALDDIVHYLADRRQFPDLKEIVMIGHSAGAQLMQRYAVLNELDGPLQQAGVRVRYVISSPSSYVYFEASRPGGDGFAQPKSIMCPGYNNYRYGIENPPDYLKHQNLNGEQLFRRYAGRNITYMVGARDDNPNHRYLDKACGASIQGATRVERQLNFVRYERFLSAQWQIPVNHPEFQVKGAAHGADKLFHSEDTVRRIFPQQQ